MMKKLMTTACLFVVTGVAIVSFISPIQVWGQSPTPVPPPEITWGVQIPMRDGVKLHGNLYRPRDTKEKLPVIVTMTPYTADTEHEYAVGFAKNGYIFIVVDARGRGNSGGNFIPLENEGRDGYDLVEWAARQPWSNGKVAMHGGSWRKKAGQACNIVFHSWPFVLARIKGEAVIRIGIGSHSIIELLMAVPVFRS